MQIIKLTRKNGVNARKSKMLLEKVLEASKMGVVIIPDEFNYVVVETDKFKNHLGGLNIDRIGRGLPPINNDYSGDADCNFCKYKDVRVENEPCVDCKNSHRNYFECER